MGDQAEGGEGGPGLLGGHRGGFREGPDEVAKDRETRFRGGGGPRQHRDPRPLSALHPLRDVAWEKGEEGLKGIEGLGRG